MLDNRHYLSPLFEPAAACVISEADPARDPWFASLVAGLREAFGEVPVHRLPALGREHARVAGTAAPGVVARVARADSGESGGQVASPGKHRDLLAVIRVDDSSRMGEAIELAAAHGANAAVALEGSCDTVQRARWR